MQLAFSGSGAVAGVSGVSGVSGTAPGGPARGGLPGSAPLPGAGAVSPIGPAPITLPSPADALPAPAAPLSPLALDPSFHTALAGGQQALVYLQTLATQLQGLKSDLSGKLAAGAPPDAALETRLDRLTAAWGNRQNAAGGALDGQLAYSSPPQAVQRFSVRGLSIAALQSGDKETISLALNSAGQRVVTVTALPGLSASDITQRFSQALAPAGIQVTSDAGDANGTLIFSVPEAGWTALRDSLQIKGNGVRFPAGQLVRVRADPEPEAVQPATWAVGDSSAMRLTLQHVGRAGALVQKAQAAATADLDAASDRLSAAQPAQDADWAVAAAQRFGDLAGRGGYAVTASLAAALAGGQRGRVTSLLALPVTQAAGR